MIYLNGEWMPIEDAKIPVLDRGFIFGDGIYEVIPVYRRKPFRAAGHLARLARSLASISIPNPYSDARWMELIADIIARQPFENQAVYFQVTRGVAKRDHAFPTEVTPTVFMMSNPLATPSEETYAKGVACVTAVDNRWLRCDIKATALLPNLLLRNQAVAAGAYEAVLVRDGEVTEGSSSNVFMVKDGRVWTPPLSHLILPGVTRALLIDVLQGCGIEVAEAPVPIALLRAADEIWFTSTTRDLVAVARLDGATVGNGSQPLAERAYREFQLYKGLRLR